MAAMDWSSTIQEPTTMARFEDKRAWEYDGRLETSAQRHGRFRVETTATATTKILLLLLLLVHSIPRPTTGIGYKNNNNYQRHDLVDRIDLDQSQSPLVLLCGWQWRCNKHVMDQDPCQERHGILEATTTEWRRGQSQASWINARGMYTFFGTNLWSSSS